MISTITPKAESDFARIATSYTSAHIMVIDAQGYLLWMNARHKDWLAKVTGRFEFTNIKQFCSKASNARLLFNVRKTLEGGEPIRCVGNAKAFYEGIHDDNDMPVYLQMIPAPELADDKAVVTIALPLGNIMEMLDGYLDGSIDSKLAGAYL